jgi:hypothetical protein
MLAVNSIFSIVKPMTMPVGTSQKLRQAERELATRINDRSGARHQMPAFREINRKRVENMEKARPATLDAAFAVEQLQQQELVRPLRFIAQRGIMQMGDFGWAPGALVEEAFEGVRIKRACPNFETGPDS